ncbi:MAG: hypothetical protein VYC17_05485 [Nitrospinota bacterium]|nr:hypothetical protein [Nitrospinota bacterium]
MDIQLILHIILITLVAVTSRLPFLRFPMDEDLATFTYRARFAHRGFNWKQDIFVFYPNWRMLLFDKWYSQPEDGVLRIRLLFMAAHVVTSLAMYVAVGSLTGNPVAALAAGLLYSFFATAPSLCTVSFNFEPLYLPFLLTGLQLIWEGAIPLAGISFGLAIVLKVSTGIYVPAMLLFIAPEYGYQNCWWFIAAAALPGLISHLLDGRLGYLDPEAKKQFDLRLAATLRCSKLKRMYGSVWKDIQLTVTQTLPLWVAGLPGIFIASRDEHGFSITLFAVTTVIMILCQRGFSRYHHIPLIGLLSLTSGSAVDTLMNAKEPVTVTILFSVVTAGTLYRLIPYYFGPTEAATLAKYDKFDQFIYLPYLGKLLRRLIRMRKEGDRRIFVWGNFIQLYHETGLPAADRFIHYCMGPWDNPVLESYFDTIIGGLIRHQPIYLIKTYQDLNLETVEQVTGLRYQLIKVVLARFPVYRLESSTTPSRDPLTLPWQEKMHLIDQMTQGEHVPGIDKTTDDRGKKVLNECQKLCRINPQDTAGKLFLAEMQGKLGQTEASAATYEKLLQANPSDPHLRLALAEQKMKLHRPQETKHARQICEGLWEPPRSADDDGLRTRAAIAIAKLDSAWCPETETLTEYLSRDPYNEPLAYARASALDRQGDRDQARSLFKTFSTTFAKKPLRAAAWFRLARLSPSEEQVPMLKQCLELDPSHSGARELLNNRETCRVEA